MNLENFFKRAFAGVAMAAALAVGGTAHADVATIDVGGISSVDGLGDADNETRTLQVAAFTHVLGISWDVSLFAEDPSWLSEIAVRISNGLGQIVDLAPGSLDNFPGSGSYSSGGFIDLVGLGFDFYANGSGTVFLEFFERFDDFDGQADGQWQRGSSISLRTPEPASMGLIAAALLAAAGATRRRRVAVAAA